MTEPLPLPLPPPSPRLLSLDLMLVAAEERTLTRPPRLNRGLDEEEEGAGFNEEGGLEESG